MIPRGGGRRILGILELFVEDYAFELVGQLPDFSRVLSGFDLLEKAAKSAIGSVGGYRSGFHLLLSGAVDVRPPRLSGLTGAFNSLFGSHFRGAGATAFLATESAQGDRGGVLSRHCHTFIIRERSRFNAKAVTQVGM
jgi:hypothetical protein